MPDRAWQDAALLLVTRDGTVLDADEATAELTGRPLDDLCGSALGTLFGDLARHAADLPTGPERQTTGRLVRADGHEVAVEVLLRALTPSTVQLLVRRLPASNGRSSGAGGGGGDGMLRRQLEVLETVREIGTVLHGTLGEAAVVERTLEALARLGWTSAAFCLADGHGMRLAGTRGGEVDPASAAVLAEWAAERAAEVCVVVAAQEREPAVREALVRLASGAAVALPVRFEGAVTGVLLLLHPERPVLPEALREALPAIGRVVGVALADARDRACREQEIAERERAEEALRQSRARYRAITEAIPDLIFRITREGRYTFVAAHDEGLLAQPPEMLIGRTLDEGIGPEAAVPWHAAVRTALDEGGLQRLEYALVTQDGQEHVFEGRVVPIPEEDEVQVIVRDITERVRYEETLVEARDRAEEMGRLKASFLANMSHEIRTPLTAILGLADVIAPDLAGEPRELLDLVRASAQRLTSTLNSVLDLAQLEAGVVQLRPTRTDLGVLVRETAATYTREASARGLVLICEIPPDPLVAHIDPTAVVRVLINLVSNAIKFTDAGHVRMTLEGAGDAALLVVEDTGIGIEPTFLPHVFEEFRQESEGISRTHQGAGLGLTITRHLVERMGGEIGVRSAPGAGTTFRVRLPLGCSEGA